jgi:folate-binding protein YgfZ
MTPVLVRDLTNQGRLRLTGEDRVRFLHSMVTNDIEALVPGGGCRAAMLTVKGKLLGEMAIYCDPDALMVEVEGGIRHKIVEFLTKHIVMDDVELEDQTDSTRELAVYGPGAKAAIETALGASVPELAPYAHAMVGSARVASAPDLAMPGYHVFSTSPDLQIAGQTLDEDAYDVLRIEAGRPRYGVDADEERLVLEAGMDDAISLTKGCYLGQEVVARATARGHINRKLVGLYVDGPAPVARGSKLSGTGRDDAGQVTSSVFSPRAGSVIALGYVHRTLWDPGTALTVHDAGGPRTAKVAALPFAGKIGT